ncbi:hypothetical protein HDU76_005356 [Blyttiomyces sp. JEL0837]|nr:hypothetical protein HDU76_005356 [Blyttiomyces sp. JEL0837]
MKEIEDNEIPVVSGTNNKAVGTRTPGNGTVIITSSDHHHQHHHHLDSTGVSTISPPASSTSTFPTPTSSSALELSNSTTSLSRTGGDRKTFSSITHTSDTHSSHQSTTLSTATTILQPHQYQLQHHNTSSPTSPISTTTHKRPSTSTTSATTRGSGSGSRFLHNADSISFHLRHKTDTHFLQWLCAEQETHVFLTVELAKIDPIAAADVLKAADRLKRVVAELNHKVLERSSSSVKSITATTTTTAGDIVSGGGGAPASIPISSIGGQPQPVSVQQHQHSSETIFLSSSPTNVHQLQQPQTMMTSRPKSPPLPMDITTTTASDATIKSNLHETHIISDSNVNMNNLISPRRTDKDEVSVRAHLGGLHLFDNLDGVPHNEGDSIMISQLGEEISATSNNPEAIITMNDINLLTTTPTNPPIPTTSSTPTSMDIDDTYTYSITSDKEKEKITVCEKKDSGLDLEFEEGELLRSGKYGHPHGGQGNGKLNGGGLGLEHVGGRFYFPFGRPGALQNGGVEGVSSLDSCKIKLQAAFEVSESDLHGKGLTKKDLWPVMDACNLPRYASFAVHRKLHGDIEDAVINFAEFWEWWSKFSKLYHDEFSIIFQLIVEGNQKHVSPNDFNILIEEVVQRHPGLEFLASMPIFQARYVETVTTRIFYTKIHNRSEQMTLAEFRRHVFLPLFKRLQHDDDINAARDIFSYKHFFVIYCKFWELDTDHDMIIEGDDLYRYDRHALTSIAVDRILKGIPRRLSTGPGSRKLAYKDFIWFVLSVEDKNTIASIEYWFRCLDLDSDGIISLYEVKEFYNEQLERMLDYRMSDPWKYEDFACSLIDLIKPKNPAYITLSDVKHCRNAALFFDMIFDIRKYDTHIRRIDPAFREIDDVWIEEGGKKIKLEGWDKFAERAYEQLALEESGQRSRSYQGSSHGQDNGYQLEDLDDEWEHDHMGWTHDVESGNVTASGGMGGGGSGGKVSYEAGAFDGSGEVGSSDDDWEDDEDSDDTVEGSNNSGAGVSNVRPMSWSSTSPSEMAIDVSELTPGQSPRMATKNGKAALAEQDEFGDVVMEAANDEGKVTAAVLVEKPAGLLTTGKQSSNKQAISAKVLSKSVFSSEQRVAMETDAYSNRHRQHKHNIHQTQRGLSMSESFLDIDEEDDDGDDDDETEEHDAGEESESHDGSDLDETRPVGVAEGGIIRRVGGMVDRQGKRKRHLFYKQQQQLRRSVDLSKGSVGVESMLSQESLDLDLC